jgi:hypothetical protein
MSGDPNHELVKELSSAVSTQAQVANRTWLALITIALLALLPRAPTSNGNLSLPFSLGEVNTMWFNVLVYSFLVVFAIAFASAHAQQMRTQSLTQAALDSLSASYPTDDQIHPREFFDMLRMPSFNRVAPLAQLLRGKYQFYKTSRECPAWLRGLTVVYHVLLKVTSLAVYFGLPFWALCHAYANVLNVQSNSFVTWCARVGGLLAGSALLVVLFAEIVYASKITKILWLPPK